MKRIEKNGQALLPVVIIIAIFLILAVGLVNLSLGGLLLSFSLQEGEKVLLATEGTLEEGFLSILRNPSYAGGSLQVGEASCTIETSGSGPVVMAASCQSDRAVRRLRAEISFVAGEMEVSNIREVE